MALGTKPKPRGVLVTQAGTPIRANWTVANSSKTGEKDVLVHCFIVRQSEIGQAAVPKLDKDVAAESALTMDFEPKDKASGTFELQIEAPGAYLVRVEILGGANGTSSPEQFAALDLVVKPGQSEVPRP